MAIRTSMARAAKESAWCYLPPHQISRPAMHSNKELHTLEALAHAPVQVQACEEHTCSTPAHVSKPFAMAMHGTEREHHQPSPWERWSVFLHAWWLSLACACVCRLHTWMHLCLAICNHGCDTIIKASIAHVKDNMHHLHVCICSYAHKKASVQFAP